MKQITTLLYFLFFASALSFAQSVRISGTLLDEDGDALPGATVSIGDTETTTDEKGYFAINFQPDGPVSFLNVFKAGFTNQEIEVETAGKSQIDLLTIKMTPIVGSPAIRDAITGEDRIPIITLSEGEEETELGSQNISGILSASRDPFIAAAAFNLGNGGFEIRGYDAETVVLFNGMPFNNLENGAVFWSVWGGLNDVTRSRESAIDLSPSPYTFGGIGGYTAFDTRASEQRRQKRLSYMFSNRAYNGRAMATWSTGMMRNGWAFSFSGSKRWATEGYVPGTFYDSYSYFASIDRKIGSDHLLNLTALGTPTRRGSQGAAIQQMNDEAGTNFYNPHWGWQGGEKRNSRVVKTHQPLFILRHDWQINNNSSLTTAAGYQFGRYGRTNLDWFNAPDPRPDFYRNTSLYFASLSPELGQQVDQIYRDNPDLLQIQWDNLYGANQTVNLQNTNYFNLHKFFDGTSRPEGFMSQYILDEQRSDTRKFNATSTYQSIVSDHLTVNAGLTWQQEKTHYFRTVNDLLGGDYFINVDRFALSNPRLLETLYNPAFHGSIYDVAKADLGAENVVVKEGDTYGWDYDINGQQFGTWLQGLFTFSKVDFFLAGQSVNTTFWRTGYMQNGRFPETSLGESDKQTFTTYGAKGGLTFKIDGRNYLYANGAIFDRAPDARIAYASPRNREQIVPGLTKEKVYSWEAGFQHRSPRLKARATFFYTQINDGMKLLRFFVDDVDLSGGQFGSYILTGLDRRHAGVELAVEAKITPTLTATGAASLGEYIYTSRPQGYLVQDNDGVIRDRGTIYLKNFYVPNTPQTAASLGLEYRSPQFWSASVTVNYFDRNYIDVTPERRREDIVFGETVGSDKYNTITFQEKVPDAFTVDLFANKSFKINSDVFFTLTAGVTNLLNTTVIQGGYEQLRYDKAEVANTGVNFFPPRYFYAYGTNFFVLGALRF
ncbi:MAG: TonB-dependent receptor [Lewinellaceae bacterium]|nr:TonB-dependent receptor [Saprospiraceae bacterium]MCB9341487.1 TonB-dependent receptor [Lewinellaceae bacterium]